MTDWNLIANPAKGVIKVITPVTGTTTNLYVDAVDLDTRWLKDTVITIANVAAVNELDYQVLVYNDYAAGISHRVFSGPVAVSDTVQVSLIRHARVKVQVKSTSSGNHTNYQIDSIGGR